MSSNLTIFKKLTSDNPQLFETSSLVDVNEINSIEFQQLCDFLASEMIKNDGVGMAAPQYGIMKEIMIIDSSVIDKNRDTNKDITQPVVLINPVIEITNPTLQENPEGCFSVVTSNDVMFFAEVKRPTAIKVTALNRNGQQIELSLENFQAQIFQHEYDHFKGIRFFQRVSDDALFRVVPDAQRAEYRALRKRGEAWPHTCTKAELAKKLNIPLEKTAFIPLPL